jgi:hypothetical protein
MFSETQEAHMLVKTAEFTLIVGETYSIVRNVYGRPGREPRTPGPGDFEPGMTRRYGWEDAVAWRITRLLCETGLTWDEAASVVNREDVASFALRQPNDASGSFFAVWSIYAEPGFAAWAGTIEAVAEILSGDNSDKGPVQTVRMVSLNRALVEARDLALKARYAPEGDGFRQLSSEASE